MTEDPIKEPAVVQSLGISSDRYYHTIGWRILIGLVLFICGAGMFILDWAITVASAISDASTPLSFLSSILLIIFLILGFADWAAGALFIAVPKWARMPTIVLLFIAAGILVWMGAGFPLLIFIAIIPVMAAFAIIKYL